MNPLMTKPNVLRDIVDGYVSSTNAFFNNNQNALKIIIYQAALELVNPLGSAKTKHKLLTIYMTVANRYPFHRSTVDQMQLLVLCKASEVELFGWQKILCPLLQDLEETELNGIELFDDVTAKGSVVCVPGDNLGSYGMGGFVESFSASHFCHFCLIT